MNIITIKHKQSIQSCSSTSSFTMTAHSHWLTHVLCSIYSISTAIITFGPSFVWWRNQLNPIPHTVLVLRQPWAAGLNHISREVRAIMQTSLMWTWPILRHKRSLQTWLSSCCIALSLHLPTWHAAYTHTRTQEFIRFLIQFYISVSMPNYCNLSAALPSLWHVSTHKTLFYLWPTYLHSFCRCFIMQQPILNWSLIIFFLKKVPEKSLPQIDSHCLWRRVLVVPVEQRQMSC